MLHQNDSHPIEVIVIYLRLQVLEHVMLILLACYKHYNQIGMALKHFWIYRALVFSTSEAVIQF